MVKKLLILVVTVLVACCIYFIAQCLWSNNKLNELRPEDKVLFTLVSNNCASCHSVDPKLPFYSSFPVIKNILVEDVRVGFRSFNVDNLINNIESPTEVDLAKIETCVEEGTMPPLKYTAIHWKTILTSKEKTILKGWAEANRIINYSSNLNSSENIAEPLQALRASLPTDSAKVDLGDLLFHDVRLSKDNTVSCATCHDLDAGGVDGLQFSKGIYDQVGGINAPTVYNAALHFAQFWDGRAADLQVQAGGPPFDALEMGNTNWDEIIVKLQEDKTFTEKFSAVYSSGYSGDNITDAIAEFEKTLLTPDSRFDLYLKGDEDAITDEEEDGYELFKENKCASCHVGEAVGGQSYEYMGIFEDYFAQRQMKADREIIQIKDRGHFNATEKEADKGYFKVPGLRNVALTGPYFHDGTVNTLEDATELMLKYEVGKKLKAEEVNEIVAFMKTLTGKYKGECLK